MSTALSQFKIICLSSRTFISFFFNEKRMIGENLDIESTHFQIRPIYGKEK